jgi:D-mannonate dehydratase
MNNPLRSPNSYEDLSKFAEVVTWVHIRHSQIYANGKYLEDFHVLTAMGGFHDMQLVVIGLGTPKGN